MQSQRIAGRGRMFVGLGLHVEEDCVGENGANKVGKDEIGVWCG